LFVFVHVCLLLIFCVCACVCVDVVLDVVKRNIDALPNDESTFQELLILGVACLLAFVQLEWTGPPLEEFVECAQESSSSAANAEALSCDGETLMSGVTCPHLLLAANAVLSHSAIDTFYPSRSWWHARCLFVHQQVLSGAAASLRDALEQQLLLAHTTFGELSFLFIHLFIGVCH